MDTLIERKTRLESMIDELPGKEQAVLIARLAQQELPEQRLWTIQSTGGRSATNRTIGPVLKPIVLVGLL